MYEEQELTQMKERSGEEANVGWGGCSSNIWIPRRSGSTTAIWLGGPIRW